MLPMSLFHFLVREFYPTTIKAYRGCAVARHSGLGYDGIKRLLLMTDYKLPSPEPETKHSAVWRATPKRDRSTQARTMRKRTT
jgi:hypothetical protein